MIHLVGVSASGARKQRRLAQEAPERATRGALESATWGAREQVGGHLGRLTCRAYRFLCLQLVFNISILKNSLSIVVVSYKKLSQFVKNFLLS